MRQPAFAGKQRRGRLGVPRINHLLTVSCQYFFQLCLNLRLTSSSVEDLDTSPVFARAPPIGGVHPPVVRGPLAFETVRFPLASGAFATNRRADIEEDSEVRLQPRLHPLLQ